MSGYEEKLERFRQRVEREQAYRYKLHDYVNPPKVKVEVGTGAWDRVDVGDSGKYMVLRDPGALRSKKFASVPAGTIFGIKAYGVPNRPIWTGGHFITVENFDEVWWGDYSPIAKAPGIYPEFKEEGGA